MKLYRIFSNNQLSGWRLMALLVVSSALLLSACAPSSSMAELVLDPTRVSISNATPQADTISATSTAATSSSSLIASGTGSALVSDKLNLNTATSDDFLTIPGMTSRMVREFMEYRPYTSLLQFRQEIGKYVSDEQVAAYEAYVYVPIDPNDSDAATLQQIPGVDATASEVLIASRPYDSTQTFLDTLAGLLNADQLAVAQTYLVTE